MNKKLYRIIKNKNATSQNNQLNETIEEIDVIENSNEILFKTRQDAEFFLVHKNLDDDGKYSLLEKKKLQDLVEEKNRQVRELEAQVKGYKIYTSTLDKLRQDIAFLKEKLRHGRYPIFNKGDIVRYKDASHEIAYGEIVNVFFSENVFKYSLCDTIVSERLFSLNEYELLRHNRINEFLDSDLFDFDFDVKEDRYE